MAFSFMALLSVREAGMAELERPQRLQIMLTVEELAALENWRFEKRMPSRSAAVRELLRRGLSSDGFLTAGAGSRSQDFGVISLDRKADDGSGDSKP
jgi:hypothetical protein